VSTDIDPNPAPAADDFADGGNDEGSDRRRPDRRWWEPPSAFQAIAMVVALLFLGGAFSWALTTRADNAEPSAVDVGFAQDMITHHFQALQISFVALERATEASTRSYAQEVVLFQAREIGIFDTWLQDWRKPEDGDRPTVMGWMGMPIPREEMPGLATDAELEELQQATGLNADRLFFELMTAHHLGGIHMATYAAQHGDEARVRELAALFARTQQIEVREYEAAIERLGL